PPRAPRRVPRARVGATRARSVPPRASWRHPCARDPGLDREPEHGPIQPARARPAREAPGRGPELVRLRGQVQTDPESAGAPPRAAPQLHERLGRRAVPEAPARLRYVPDPAEPAANVVSLVHVVTKRHHAVPDPQILDPPALAA